MPEIASGHWRQKAAAWRRPDNGDPLGGIRAETFLWTLTDLMTLLLVFFVLLYANAVHTPAPGPASATLAGHGVVASGAAGIFPDAAAIISPTETPAKPPQRQERVRPAEELPSAIERTGRRMVSELSDRFNRDFYVRWEDRLPVIVLGERITFDAGEALLLNGAQEDLQRVARAIRTQPACQVVVTGHTDDRPINTHTYPSNWELSAARAASVAKMLVENGVPPGQVLIQGRSEFKPLVANTDATGRRTNRRVEIALKPPGAQPSAPAAP